MQQAPPQFRCVVLGNTAAAPAAEELQVFGERAAASALLFMCVFLLFCPISYLVAAATAPAAAAAAALLQDGDLHFIVPRDGWSSFRRNSVRRQPIPPVPAGHLCSRRSNNNANNRPPFTNADKLKALQISPCCSSS